MRLLFLFILSPLFLFSQVQIANDIDGAAGGDQSGIISFSSNGNIVAIGGPGNDDAGNDAGHVRIFKNIQGVWTQIGNTINGEAAGDNFGSSVSLSSDGSIVAIGAPYNDNGEVDAGNVSLFENISGTWTQIGSDINGEATGDRLGRFVSLSNDGTKLAIVREAEGWCEIECGLSPGYTSIFENINGNWIQVGQEINTGFDGVSDVKLSSNGGMVAIASPSGGWYGWSNYFSGGVKVYVIKSGIWTQIGQTFYADTCYWCSNNLGGVSFANNGLTLAIVDSFNFRVYKYTFGGDWIQQGEDVELVNSYNKVSLSDDGTILAVGGIITRLYQISSGNWTKLGDDINEETSGYGNQINVEFSSDGSKIAVGNSFNDGNDINADSGKVRVYDLSSLLSVEESSVLSVKFYPNPTTNQFTIELPQSQTLEKVNIYNNLGQFIKTSQKNIIDTSQLTSGLYFVEVVTSQGKATKKLIIK
jgi:Flp pilus assembly pilin Flp